MAWGGGVAWGWAWREGPLSDWRRGRVRAGFESAAVGAAAPWRRAGGEGLTGGCGRPGGGGGAGG